MTSDQPVQINSTCAGSNADTAKDLPPAIEGRGVAKRFGKADALHGLDIRVPRGSVYALLGRNGAGKSTLIQIVMGMLEASAGKLAVLGRDPKIGGAELRNQLGYIPERMPMYDWMSVGEILGFVASIYANWSTGDEKALVDQFGLDRGKRVVSLSRGSRALLALVIAMAHRPDLVLIDECTSGMDAIARREFERSVIDTLHGSGRTVLFASHQIDELERICDWVGVVHNGRMIVEAPIDTLKERIVMARISGEWKSGATFPGGEVLDVRRSGRDTLVTIDRKTSTPRVDLPAGDARIEEIIPLSLEEIFVALVGREQQ